MFYIISKELKYDSGDVLINLHILTAASDMVIINSSSLRIRKEYFYHAI